jgi:hypothetical protein
MDATARIRGQAGQATVEHVGLVLVIALLLGAVAAWAATERWAPDRPPDVIARVAAPLLQPGRQGWQGVMPAPAVAAGQQALERVSRAMDRGDDGQPGTLRRAWDALLWWGALNVDGQVEAGAGFLEQVGIRAEDLVKDPVKTIEGAVDRLGRPPVTGTAERVGRIARTVASAGDRPFRETFLGVSRDLGGLGADWLIAKFARGVGGLLKGLLPG